jgi:chloride channel protein, CIC family
MWVDHFQGVRSADFERLPLHWMWWSALGGLAVGVGGLLELRALGVGYDVIGDLLGGHLLLQAVLAILLVKAVIWLVALSSGTSGGVLAPLLIIGGAAGWMAGLVLPGAPGAWALAGMAAMLGGTMRAPLTGAVFAVELTGDLALLPAALAGAATGYAVTVLLMKRSILTEKIARRGQHITREYGIDRFELARAADVMVREVDSLSAALPLDEAVAALAQGRHCIYPVVDVQDRPVGLVSRADALRWSLEETARDGATLGQMRVGRRARHRGALRHRRLGSRGHGGRRPGPAARGRSGHGRPGRSPHPQGPPQGPSRRKLGGGRAPGLLLHPQEPER